MMGAFFDSRYRLLLHPIPLPFPSISNQYHNSVDFHLYLIRIKNVEYEYPGNERREEILETCSSMGRPLKEVLAKYKQ
mgnify:CR=1 FL=1